MNHTQLIELLHDDRYKALNLPIKTGYPEFEALNYYGDQHTVFDDLKEELGRPPTPWEYGRECLGRAEEFFTKNVNQEGGVVLYCKPLRGNRFYHSFKWDKRLAYAVLIRQQRAYLSYLIEEVYIKWLLEYKRNEVKIGVSKYLDIVEGVDLAIGFKEHDYIMYAHITNSRSVSSLGHKERRNQRNSNGTYRRDFTNHVIFTYDREESPDSDNINGLYIPTHEKLEKSYLDMEEKLYRLLEDRKKGLSKEESLNGNSSLQELEEWLSGGLWNNKEPLTLGDFWQETTTNQTV